MIITDYGNYTKVFLKTFGISYTDELLPGHQQFEINTYCTTDDGVRKFVLGYCHMRHKEIIKKHGACGFGWAINEIIGKSVVNPHGIRIK